MATETLEAPATRTRTTLEAVQIIARAAMFMSLADLSQRNKSLMSLEESIGEVAADLKIWLRERLADHEYSRFESRFGRKIESQKKFCLCLRVDVVNALTWALLEDAIYLPHV